MSEKQPQLNGAYYGPSVPPPRQTYHRPGRGSGCGCCGCLFRFLFSIIISVVVILGLAVLIFWLIFRPINAVKFHVTDASLSQFSFTSNDTLQYSLALNISVRNPNKKIGIYYETIEARAYYEDQLFDAETLTPFYQGHKTTSVLNPVFEGQHLVVLGTNDLSAFDTEKTAGVYSIDVKLYLQVKFKVGKIKTWRFKPKVECDLKVPLSSSTGTSAGAFQTTKCDIDL